MVSLSSISIDEFIKELDRYIRWYNEKRIKQSLGYLSPLEYADIGEYGCC